MWSREVRIHYERHPYPHYPLICSIPRHNTYALNLQSLWAKFNGEFMPPDESRILLAGSGSFAPYPMGVANPRAEVTAMDLSGANLRRARWHCSLHNCRNVRFTQGDLLNPAVTPGPFHMIDAYGVLHHLEDPASGLRSLERRLARGGIIRVMVYGRYARREAESIRRAVKCLGIRNVSDLKRFLRQAGPGSRIRNFLDNSWEARSDSGLADLFLHPCVRTYRIDEFLAMVGETRLKPLLFAHDGALQDLSAEIDRLRELDRRRETTTNLVCYLGLETHGPCLLEGTAVLQLNPCLHGAVSPYHVRPVEVMSRLGCDNPLLDRTARRFLRRFQAPVPVQDLSPEEMAMAQRYLPIHFLMAFKSEQSHILPAAHASKLPGRKRLSPFEP